MPTYTYGLYGSCKCTQLNGGILQTQTPISTSVRTRLGQCSHAHIPQVLKRFHGELSLKPGLAPGIVQLSQPQFLHL